MFKYLGYVFRVVPIILWYYPLMLKNALRRDKISFVRRYNDSRKIISKAAKGLHAEFIVDGLDKLPAEQGYLLTPNHQSFMDMIGITTIFSQPLSVVAKKESKHYIFVKRIIAALEGKYLDRDDLRQEMKVMIEIRKSLQNENKKWLIYPEGRRSSKENNYAINEFKPGAFKPAINAKVKIFPIASWGSFRVLDPKVKGFKKYPIQISILDPILPEEYENLSTTEVAKLVQDRVQKRLDELKIKDVELVAKYSKKNVK